MKKLLFSFIITSILFGILYYLTGLYDSNQTILPRIISNKYYIIFLYISIILGIRLYGQNNQKIKKLLIIIFLLNFIYLCVSFIFSNIDLLKLNNISLYENGPDYEGFNKQFNTKLIIYSDISLEGKKASIIKNDKSYEIYAGTHEYTFTKKSDTQTIMFKSDELYPNTYCILLFKGGEFIQIYPQSAIEISPDYNINNIVGEIKYYPPNPTQFIIDGNNSNLQTNEEIIQNIQNIYIKDFRLYTKKQLGGNFNLNKNILIISKKILTFLTKINSKYENNLQNLTDFAYLFNINLDTQKNKVDHKSIILNIGKNLEKGINNAQN